jgi:hypothetical protein
MGTPPQVGSVAMTPDPLRAGSATKQLRALQRIYELHTFTRGHNGILGAACVEGCQGAYPCETRRVAAEVLALNPEAP